MESKKGITLASMVLYVVLFFIFMTFAIAMSSNMNYRTLSEKGVILNNKEFEKLQYNLISSASNSSSVEKTEKYISFSNGDIYTYDSEKSTVYKNGGILVQNVSEFSPLISIENLIDVDSNAKNNINEYEEYVCLNVKFTRYNQETFKQIFISVRGDDKLE